MTDLLEGQRITQIWTLGSHSDMQTILIQDDEGNRYRMKIKEWLKIIKNLTFRKVPKRKYVYLEIESFMGEKV